MMNFWAFADKNPGWTFLFLLVVAYGVEQAAKALRGPGKKRKRN
ncbi:hypothetical protein QE529_13935 [Escherichia coli]|nr:MULTISPECIES: hypothetical protein [Enterobacteriaceae]MCV1507043.1 hypothetical protein [Escherichia coli]MDF8407749.1 hypothetical protein [Escherichia coli]MDF8461365.1 hypothetical protein [Escherichia coli]MDH6727471.1 hypothetical protein [Escherichia coli]MDH6890531.1 hypothetical protein [Escherichia coli]